MSEQTRGQEQTQSQGPAEGSQLGQGAENRQTAEATVDTQRDRQDDPRVSEAPGHDAQVETPAERNLSGDQDDQDEQDEHDDDRDGDEASPEADRKSAEEFAAEHDPEQHDIAAGEELRQRGDWTADDTGGQQVWDAEGHLVDGAGPGSGDAQTGGSDHSDNDEHHDSHDHHEAGGGRRTSSIEEIRDGGYGVGSAAPLDDNASPFGHPVKAWNDTRTFVDADHPRYDDAEPHVWFTDSGAAEQAGFRRADD